MTIPSLTHASWHWYLLWQSIAFAIAMVVNSFVEWIAHRFILHSKAIVQFAYDLHHVRHHTLFGSDKSYEAQTEDVKAHVRFGGRDYVMFLAVTFPLWCGMEFLCQRPMVLGGVTATLFGLQCFNTFHGLMHVPRGNWFERTWFFRFIKEHHRLHHANPMTNLNVAFLPLADLVLGTLRRGPEGL